MMIRSAGEVLQFRVVLVKIVILVDSMEDGGIKTDRAIL